MQDPTGKSNGDAVAPPETDMSKIAPVILAAGDSRRMGHPKALLPLGEETFITRILSTLQGLHLANPCVVLGSHASQIQESLRGWNVEVVINPHPEHGQISSLKLAVERLDRSAKACLVWPVDQPAVSADLIEKLVRLFERSGALLVLPRCAERRGHPAIFSRAIFEELLALPPGEGAKNLVTRYAAKTTMLATEERATVEDIDTPEDYYRLTGEELEAALARRGISRAWSEGPGP
jgi:molybdenum cofactor cytidylyltransferase